MKVNDLKKALSELGANPAYFSLSGDLVPDAYILYQNYNKWEVFYLDERGGRNYQKVFSTEEDACEYILQVAIDGKKHAEKFGTKNSY